MFGEEGGTEGELRFGGLGGRRGEAVGAAVAAGVAFALGSFGSTGEGAVGA